MVKENLLESFHFFVSKPLKISIMSFLKKNKVLSAVAKCKIIVNNKPSFGSKEFPKITLNISI